MLSWDAQINPTSGLEPSHQSQFEKEVCTTLRHLPAVQITCSTKHTRFPRLPASWLLPLWRSSFSVGACAKVKVLLAVLWADRCQWLIRAEVKVHSEHVCSTVSALPLKKTCSMLAKVMKANTALFKHGSTWILLLAHPCCAVQWFLFQTITSLHQVPSQWQQLCTVKPVHFLFGNIDFELKRIKCVATEQDNQSSFRKT